MRKTSQSETIQSIFALFGSNIFAAVIGVVGSFIQGRFVSPQDLGFFRQFGIISAYFFFLHLGIFHAIERMYPYYLGRGERGKAIKIVEVGNAWISIVCIPICMIFIILSSICFYSGNWKSGLGWLAQVVAISSSLYGGFLSSTYRSGRDFKKMAKAQVFGPLGALLAFPIFWIQPYVALFVRNASSILSLWQLHKNRPVKVPWKFSFKEWKQLVKQGLPRFSASYISTTGLDAFRATVILKEFGTLQLGYWSFSWMIVILALQLPQAITAVYIPRIIEIYGKTSSASKALSLSRKPVISGLIVSVIFLPFGMFGVLKILPIILPMYSDTAGIIAILLLSLPLKIVDAPSSVLNAMNKLVFINLCAIINSVIQIMFIVVGSFVGWGIWSAAYGYVMGNLARTIMIWGFLKYTVGMEEKLRRFGV